MTKKTILVLTIIVALIIALYKWLTSDNEEQKQPVEETKAATSEKEMSSQKRMPRRLKKMAKTQ